MEELRMGGEGRDGGAEGGGAEIGGAESRSEGRSVKLREGRRKLLLSHVKCVAKYY